MSVGLPSGDALLPPAHLAPQRPTARGDRIVSVDIVRGAVMVLMAIDHVRVFSGLPAGGPTPGIFFTRWITHFCAPAFVFFAGTSAFLSSRRALGPGALSRFLLTRGAWLILLELTVIRLSWTFNLDFAHYLLAGVIWAIGWSMIALAGLVWLPLPAVAAVGLVIIAGHNLAAALLLPSLRELAQGSWAWVFRVAYFGGPVPLGADGPPLVVLYSLIPWAGVMAAGFAFGALLRLPPERHRRWCLSIGGGATVLFLVLRGFNLYGNPTPWGADGARLPPVLDFLATNKYPASFQFLLMTLGPTIALLPLLERGRDLLSRGLAVFGRVPLFFYLLHIPLIHAMALGVSALRSGSITPWLFTNHPMMNPPPPEGYTWSLGLLYLVWLVAVALLYLACGWFAGVKRRHPGGWLSYL